MDPETLVERIAGLERLLQVEVRRLEEKVTSQERAVTLVREVTQIAQDKFEATVQRDSVKTNEFRGSLADLSADMATRRELEALQTVTGARLDDLAKQLGDLRSRIDIGPAGLAALQSGASVQLGRRQGVQLTTGLFFSGLAALATLVGLIVAVATHI